MEATLTEFLENSWPPSKNTLVRTNKKRVEGVWITAKTGLEHTPLPHKEEVVNEDDEMIWWSWDGRFIGFADW